MNEDPRRKLSARIVLLFIIALMVWSAVPGLIIYFQQPPNDVLNAIANISLPAFLLSMPLALVLVLISHVHRRLAIAAIFVTLFANAYFCLPRIT